MVLVKKLVFDPGQGCVRDEKWNNQAHFLITFGSKFVYKSELYNDGAQDEDEKTSEHNGTILLLCMYVT